MRSELFALLLAIAACGSPAPDPNDPPDAPPVAPDTASLPTASLVAVGMFAGPGDLHIFDASSDGDAQPLRTIRSGPRPLTSVTALRFAGSELFVCDRDNIQVFDVDAEGTTTPKRFLEGPDSEVNCNGMFVFGGEIFETGTGGRLLVHELEAAASSSPLRAIFGPRDYSWVHVHGTEIFASGGSTIDVFPIDASGTVDPVRSLQLSEIDAIAGFQVTATEVFVANVNDTKLRVYDATTGGAPIRVLKGLPLDSRAPRIVGNELFIAHSGPVVDGSQTMGSYSVFDLGASEFDDPLRRVSIPSNGTVSAIDAH